VATRRIAELDSADTAGWREFKTLWFSLPAYQGPFVIRAKPLDSPGPILLGGSDGLPATAAPLVVPPGPTLNGGGSWRTHRPIRHVGESSGLLRLAG
jgi:hypothetical protein